MTMVPAMTLALDANFGSVDAWRDAFAAFALAVPAGTASVELAFVPREGRLVHQPAGGDGQPLLAMGLPQDAAAFIAGIDWGAVYTAYQHAVHAASGDCGATHDDVTGTRVVDVRRAGVFAAAQTMLPGATWRDPTKVGAWAGELAGEPAVTVYCIYGHEVGRATTLRLRAAGVPARYLDGGIDGWQAASRPVVAKPAG